MTGRSSARPRPSRALLAILALAVPASLAGQQGGSEGFLFSNPRVSVGLRTGFSVARAGSDIFNFTREQLTVERSDFSAPFFGGEVAVRAAERLDIALTVSHARSETRSEFRDWVGADDLPIEQVTEFTTSPVTLTAKYYLRNRGRSVGRFVWIPERWSPYLGAGAGFVWYRFEQNGEWVDFETLDIFRDRFVAEGTAPTVHVLGGVDIALNNRLVFAAEGRYGWARGDLGRDFVGFDKMDLAGFQASAGLSIRF